MDAVVQSHLDLALGDLAGAEDLCVMGRDGSRGFLGKEVIGGLAGDLIVGDAVQLLEAPADHDVAPGRVLEFDRRRRAVHDPLQARLARRRAGSGEIAPGGGIAEWRQNCHRPAIALDHDRLPVPGQTIQKRPEVDRAVLCGRCRHMALLPTTRNRA